MSFEPQLRTDVLTEDLTTSRESVKIIVETQFNNIVRNSEVLERTKTPQPAKNIVEVMELIGQAIDDYQEREDKNADARVHYIYSKPDQESQLEAVTVELIDRDPGVMARTSLRERGGSDKIRNLRPILRELAEDPDHPGYQRAVLGYFFDNTIRLTCWARSNKTALERGLWLEEVMEQYLWFFVLSGTNRILYDGRGPGLIDSINNNKIYGVTLDYFVRTEKLRAVSQKKLEQIYIKLALRSNT